VTTRKLNEPDVGYEHRTKELFELWWPKPDLAHRCEGSVGPIVADKGRILYSHQCQIGGAERHKGHWLCWRHRAKKDEGRLVLFPPKE
jgi:hypothetical protein